MSDITIDSLTITLGLGDEARKILDDVSFSVRSGQSFGLVGESGSGKSTILKCIGLLFNAWTGKIEIGGKSVRETARKAYCRDVQMVFQDPYGSLHPRHSIRTTLAEPLIDPRARPAGAADGAGDWSTSACRRPFSTAIRMSSAAGSGSGWRSPGHWCWSRRCCCSTSRPRRSTCRCRPRC